MKKAVFFSGYLAASCIALGLTLKTFHWDGGWTFLLAGFSILLLYSVLWFSHSLTGFPQKPVEEKVQIVSGAGGGVQAPDRFDNKRRFSQTINCRINLTILAHWNAIYFSMINK